MCSFKQLHWRTFNAKIAALVDVMDLSLIFRFRCQDFRKSERNSGRSKSAISKNFSGWHSLDLKCDQIWIENPQFEVPFKNFRHSHPRALFTACASSFYVVQAVPRPLQAGIDCWRHDCGYRLTEK
jgi:hypothetical protein